MRPMGFIEFAGGSGVGKTAIAAQVRQILEVTEPGHVFHGRPELSTPVVLRRSLASPGLLRIAREAHLLQPRGRVGPLWEWLRRIVEADTAVRLSRRDGHTVVSREVVFHWLKKFPFDAQRELARLPLPLPDRLIVLVASPAERIWRTARRPRALQHLARISDTELVARAEGAAREFLACAPPDRLVEYLAVWNTNQAAGRLDDGQRRSVAERVLALGIDVREDAQQVPMGEHLLVSAQNFGIPALRIVNSEALGIDGVARAVVAELRADGPGPSAPPSGP